MKKLISTLSVCLFFIAAHAQLIIQRAFTPQNGNQYFELYNNTTSPIDLNCYTLLTHFRNLDEAGFYMVRFPQSTLGSNETMLIGNREQLNPVNPLNRIQLSWQDLGATGLLEKYNMSENQLQLFHNPITALDREVKNTFKNNLDYIDHVVFLFNGATLVDASVNLDAEKNLPDFLNHLPQLSYTNNCGGQVTIAINTIRNRFPNIFNNPNLQHERGYFKEFQVQQNSSSVQIAWQTMRDQQNRGFHIERRSGTGTWSTVAYVAALSPEGNSNNESLQYFYGDRTILNDRTEYRLRSIDMNGKAFYSPTKIINAYGEVDPLAVYPNPSRDGSANISFGTVNSLRDVQVIDMNGQLVQQWVSVNSPTQQVQNLKTGHYVVRVIDRQTGAITTKKLVVKN